MRQTPALFSIVVMVFVVLAVAGGLVGTAAQEGTPAAGQGFAGSWRVAVTPAQGPPLVGLSTYGADGTVLSSALPVQQPPPGAPTGPIFAGTAHGAWEATSADTANVTFIELRANGQGESLGTLTVRAGITLGADGQTLSGDFVLTVADPAGNPVASSAGAIEATRIVAEAPVEVRRR